MQLCKVRGSKGQARVGIVKDGRVHLVPGSATLSSLLHGSDPAAAVQALLPQCEAGIALDSLELLPPLDDQEVWAAGVTYKRSREARERESVGAARFYDLVYTAE